MKRLIAALIVFVAAANVAAAQAPTAEQRALRTRLEQRFDLVPLTDGIALRPKAPLRDVRLIEVAGGAILVNGAPVTGQELRERIGADADPILQLSYLGADARRALIEPGEPVEAPRTDTPRRPAEPPPAPEPTQDSSRQRRSSGDRVRILGDVTVRADERIEGDVVAVLGSVRVDGEVRGQVVSVMGSVDLGPEAIVNHDVVSVGGRVRRSEGAQIRGGVTEVSIAEPNVRLNFEPLVDWRGVYPFDGFGALPRLVGTAFRFMLLVLLTSIALVVARQTVEASAHRVSDRPVQATLVGIAAQILIVPALVLTAVVLAISIIGIPLLLLIPFAVLVLVLMALAGFSGTVFAVGQWARRRIGLGSTPPIVDLALGVTIVLLPVLVARLIAFAGWPGASLAIPLLMLGFVVELIAWSSGFGAVLTNTASRWQARRSARNGVPPPMAP
ncbi:MAG: hypothetical protein ACRD1U_01915 [Vicinamibacterales bacterium]